MLYQLESPWHSIGFLDYLKDCWLQIELYPEFAESWLNGRLFTSAYNVPLLPSSAAMEHVLSVKTPDTEAQFVGRADPLLEYAKLTVDTLIPK